MQVVHLLFQGLAPDHCIARVGRGWRTAIIGTRNEIILLDTVSEKIEILTLWFLLRLILLQNIETLLLLKRLVTHIFEALAATVYHVDGAVLVA